jgi:transposase-like protein
MTDTHLLRLKTAIARHRRERASRNVRFPAAVRREAVAHGRERRAAGASLLRIASELGVAMNTLERWLQLDQKMKLHPVSVQQEERRSALKSALVLHGPGGVRVEGLDPESVAAILRALA